MFLSTLLLPLALMSVLTAAIPTESGTVVEDNMPSPKPSIDTALASEVAPSYIIDSSASETLTSISFPTVTSTVQTQTTPETSSETIVSPTGDVTILPEPTDIWIPDTPSSTTSCTDINPPKGQTKSSKEHHSRSHSHMHSTHQSQSGFHTKLKPSSKSNHPPLPPITATTCTPPYHLPMVTSMVHAYDTASNSPACIVPLLRNLLRRCKIPVDLPNSDQYPSIGLCIPSNPNPVFGTGMGYPVVEPTESGSSSLTSMSSGMSTSTSTATTSKSEIKTLVETSLTDDYTVSSTAVVSLSSSVQLPVETFTAVPQEGVPGSEDEEVKRPACGKGMSDKPCPPVDEVM